MICSAHVSYAGSHFMFAPWRDEPFQDASTGKTRTFPRLRWSQQRFVPRVSVKSLKGSMLRVT